MSKISKYFSEIELQCKCKNCGNSCPMDMVFLQLLDIVRKECGVPLNVSSGFRCNRHNKDIGGVPNSWHTKGKAADIWSAKISLDTIYNIASKYFDEVIFYKDNGFVHIGEPKSQFYALGSGINNAYVKDEINKAIDILADLAVEL